MRKILLGNKSDNTAQCNYQTVWTESSKHLNRLDYPFRAFLSSFISLKQYKNHDAMAELLLHGSELLDTLRRFLNENDNSDLGLCSASEIMVATYAREICEASAQAN
ncbi:hypothetical protein PAXRUDRAFT_174505, partial [Paxillus rubicundulus Ve08.2h10]